MSDSLSKTIWIDAPPEAVFEHFVDAEKVARWSGVSARMEAEPGGLYELDMGAAGVFRGRFLEVDPPYRLTYEVDPPAGISGPPSRISITLAEEAGGTRVKVEHAGLPGPFAALAGRGWDHHLARLSVAVQGGEPGPDSLCNRPLDPAGAG